MRHLILVVFLMLTAFVCAVPVKFEEVNAKRNAVINKYGFDFKSVKCFRAKINDVTMILEVNTYGDPSLVIKKDGIGGSVAYWLDSTNTNYKFKSKIKTEKVGRESEGCSYKVDFMFVTKQKEMTVEPCISTTSYGDRTDDLMQTKMFKRLTSTEKKYCTLHLYFGALYELEDEEYLKVYDINLKEFYEIIDAAKRQIKAKLRKARGL